VEEVFFLEEEAKAEILKEVVRLSLDWLFALGRVLT
jgi:hypothetical protein